MDLSNPLFDHENTPPSSPPRGPFFATAMPNHPVFTEEPRYAPPASPPTVSKQGMDQPPPMVYSFQDQVRLLQSMFPHMSREQMMDLIFPPQTEKVPGT